MVSKCEQFFELYIIIYFKIEIYIFREISFIHSMDFKSDIIQFIRTSKIRDKYRRPSVRLRLRPYPVPKALQSDTNPFRKVLLSNFKGCLQIGNHR